MQNIFSCLKQNKTPTVLGLLRYLNQRYKNYFPKSDIEEFEKKTWSQWNGLINHMAVKDVT